MAFFFEVLITGLMVGIMYSLVALGFVLIFKASEVFNMAQGAMSLFAGLVLVGFLTQYMHLPLWLALICTVGVMTIWAYLVVFVVLKPLVARPPPSCSSWPPSACHISWRASDNPFTGRRPRG